MQAASGSDHVNAGSQPEVIGVAEDDFGVEFRLEFLETNAFDGTGSANGHEHRRLNLPATRGQHTRPRLILLSIDLEFYRGGLGHV